MSALPIFSTPTSSLLTEIQQLATLYHLKPNQRLGQNFLVNVEVYQTMVAVASADETILEIGPGLGHLTAALAAHFASVVAVEKDPELARIVAARLLAEDYRNVKIISGDILKLAPASWVGEEKSFQVVANLPYNISSIFLRNFLAWNDAADRPHLTALTLLLQKEVAERLAAPAGEMSLLSLSAQLYGEPKVMAVVRSACFWPAPKVDSAIVSIRLRTEPLLPTDQQPALFRLARIGFAARRKMLKNNLANGLKISAAVVEKVLVAAGLRADCRAQDLGLGDWLNLLGKFSQS